MSITNIPFTQGMTLKPGESAMLGMPLKLPADAAELIRRGQLLLEVKQGPRFEDAPGKFHADVEVFLGSRLYAVCRIEWQAASPRPAASPEPASRWARWRAWIYRFIGRKK